MAVGNRTVSEVTRLGDQWTDKFNNQNQPYFLKFTEEGDEEFELSLRATSDAPTPGTVIEVEEYQDRGEFPRKIRKVYNQSGGSGGGGGAPRSGGKQNSPDTDRKIIRQHAQKVAATIWNPADKWEEFVALCDKLCEDVFTYGGTAPDPAAAAVPVPDVAEMGKRFQQMLKDANLPTSTGVEAIEKLWHRSKLEPTDDLDALLRVAKEIDSDDIPF